MLEEGGYLLSSSSFLSFLVSSNALPQDASRISDISAKKINQHFSPPITGVAVVI